MLYFFKPFCSMSASEMDKALSSEMTTMEQCDEVQVVHYSLFSVIRKVTAFVPNGL